MSGSGARVTSVAQPPSAGAQPWMDEPSLCLRQRLAGAPPDACIKGWLFRSLVDAAKRHDVDLRASRRLGFKDYPLSEYLELLGEAAYRVRPDESPKETLRLLGRGAHPAFAQSLFGKVILSGLGTGHQGARTGLGWVAHVYKLTSNHAVATITHRPNNVSLIELENVWTFPDSYHAGIFEGAAEAFGGRVVVNVQVKSLCSATLTLRWQG